jgi:hypothetical protein
MKALHLTGLTLAIAAGFALPLAGSAEAAMGGALPSTQILPVEQAQFFFLGHNFCWYDDGWQGPGWYWCNYAWRSGYGWGGGDGWHGWNRGQSRGNRGPHVMPPRDHAGPATVVQPALQPKITSGIKPRNDVVHPRQSDGAVVPNNVGGRGPIIPQVGGPGAAPQGGSKPCPPKASD